MDRRRFLAALATAPLAAAGLAATTSPSAAQMQPEVAVWTDPRCAC